MKLGAVQYHDLKKGDVYRWNNSAAGGEMFEVLILDVVKLDPNLSDKMLSVKVLYSSGRIDTWNLYGPGAMPKLDWTLIHTLTNENEPGP